MALINISGVTHLCENSKCIFRIETCNSFTCRCGNNAGLNIISLPFKWEDGDLEKKEKRKQKRIGGCKGYHSSQKN